MLFDLLSDSGKSKAENLKCYYYLTMLDIASNIQQVEDCGEWVKSSWRWPQLYTYPDLTGRFVR